MTSPTGRRVISFEHYRRQEEAAWKMHQRLRAAAIASGAKEVAPDMFDMSAIDYAAIEQRIMEQMRDPVTSDAPPRDSGSDDNE